MNIRFRLTISLLVLTSVIATRAQAQHYSLDTTFRFHGIDTIAGSIPAGTIHRPAFVLPQADNKKIVLVGDIYTATSVEIIRLNYDGTPDSSFNDSGKVVATHAYIQTPPSAATLYDTSKIITASQWLDISTGWEYISVFNFNSNGTLNTSFGTGGVVMTGFTPSLVYSYPNGCGMQTDGKIIIMGQSSVGGIEQYGLLRLLPNGTLDGTYGTGGRQLDPFTTLNTPQPGSPNAAMPRCGYMQADNKYVVVGLFSDSTSIYNAYQCFIVRHNTDGTPDLTFGDAGGITLIKYPNQDFEALAMAADSAGNYYILAQTSAWMAPFTDSNFVVIKLDHNGHRVSSYGNNGISYLVLPVANKFSSAFSVQKDGRAILGNIYRNYSPSFADKFIVYRLDTSGNLDTSFNTSSQIIAQRDSSYHDFCIAAAVQPDGKILLAGYDSLSATAICMRFTNYHNTYLPLLAHNALPATQALFTGYVFPNPVFGKEFHVHYTNTGHPGQGQLQLYNTTGQLLDSRTETLLSDDGEILYTAPSSVPAGMYYVTLTNGQGEQQVHPVTILR